MTKGFKYSLALPLGAWYNVSDEKQKESVFLPCPGSDGRSASAHVALMSDQFPDGLAVRIRQSPSYDMRVNIRLRPAT